MLGKNNKKYLKVASFHDFAKKVVQITYKIF